MSELIRIFEGTIKIIHELEMKDHDHLLPMYELKLFEINQILQAI